MPTKEELRQKAITHIMSALKQLGYINDNTSEDAFLLTTVESLKLDVPALPSDPNFDKQYLTMCIKNQYKKEKLDLKLSDEFFRTGTYIMQTLVEYCSDGNNLTAF